jgi:hypothetical protein
MPSEPPIHVAALEAFKAEIPDHLESSIAFGLFLDAEQDWASGGNPTPTEAKYRKYHSIYLRPYEIGRYRDGARQLLAEYGTNLIDAARPDFLKTSLQHYQAAALAGHRKFRWWGTVEAAVDALWWSLALIGLSFLAAWVTGIDILDYWHKALKILSGT